MEKLTGRQEVWRGLLLGQRSMMLRLMATLKKEFGLSAAQYEALLLLEGVPGNVLSASELAHGLLYSSGSASNLVARMETHGWVSRSPDAQDSRVVNVHLTKKGRELIIAATAAHVAELDQEFAPLISDEQLPVLLSFARSLADHEGVSSQPGPGE